MLRDEHQPISSPSSPVVPQKVKHEIHQLACNAKGQLIRLMKLCKELDIPFPS